MATEPERAVVMPKKISEVADRSTGALACPKCGGTSFKSKRSVKGKLAGGVFAPKSRVKCETCGEVYKRG